MIAKENKVSIDIDGDALKFGGYTKNMTQDFELTDHPAKMVLVQILARYSNDVRPDQNVVVAEQGNGLVLTTQSGAERAKQKVVLTGKK